MQGSQTPAGRCGPVAAELSSLDFEDRLDARASSTSRHRIGVTWTC
ncbi:hypothetical protein SCD90_07255 [Terrihabitans sp. PJ23]|uniref:Uncharacterized protein n=1 Tax=Terrihabitans rhizophilus TaxID=3092662 RepID=A0ABU4RMN3_9HYPH|nr:hypothetical protein [Terrihabitans sp. PJ23]